MDARPRWMAAGLAAGLALAATAYVVFGGRGASSTHSAVDPDDDARLSRLDARLRSIESAMRARDALPRVHAEPPARGAPAQAPDAAAERAATVAEVEEFLAKRLQEEDERPPAAHRFELGVGDAGTKSLDDAAKELRLRSEQVERIRDAFRAEGAAQLEAAFGTDDIESIRARIRDAATDPAARMRLQDEFLGNLLKALPRIRRAEDTKVKALQETLGSAGYESFRRIGVRESDVDEFDALFEQTFADVASDGR